MSVTERLAPAPAAESNGSFSPGRGESGAAYVGKSSVLGIPTLMAGALAFALAAFGGPSEALTPVLVVSGVVGVLAARYASRLGEVRQATIFALFAGFWLSYSALILGLTHNWYGIDPDQTGGALAIFLGSWLVVALAVTVVSLGLPASFTVLLGLFDIALVLLLIAALVETVWLYTAAGVAIALFSALATYLYLVAAAPLSIARKLPLGRVLMAEPPAGLNGTQIGLVRSSAAVVGRSSVIGMPSLMAGALAFALAAFGGPSEALTPVLVVSGVVGVLAARYASRLGEVRQASVFAVFAGFWLSYSALILGLTHNWYGIDPDQTGGALAIFLGSWLIVGLAVTVVSLSLPASFTVLLGLFDVALVLLLIGAVTQAAWLYTAAGVVIALFSVLAMYLYLICAGPSSIGRKLPLGPVLVADE